MFLRKLPLFPVITACILFISIPAIITAQETPAGTGKPVSESGTIQNGFLEIYGSRGITYPLGEISGDGGQKAHTGDSGAAGINTGYTIENRHIIYLGITALTQRFEIERNYMNKLMLTSVEAKFINFDLSYRFQEEWFYGGAGLYLGLPYGTWSRKNALDGEVTESLLYGDLKSACKKTTGLDLFCGLIFKLTDTSSFNTGLKILIPAAPAYESDQDSIKILDVAVTASVTQKFAVPFIDKEGL